LNEFGVFLLSYRIHTCKGNDSAYLLPLPILYL
jgi:hypothetical protein